MKKTGSLLMFLALLLIACFVMQPVMAAPVHVASVPGTIALNQIESAQISPRIAANGLSPMVTVIGRVNLTVGGVGMLAQHGPIKIDKQPGTTVLAAFMSSATTPGGVELPGIIQIDGQTVIFSNNVAGSFGTQNYWGNVTDLVKSKYDSAAPGMVSYDVSEGNETSFIDGEALYLIVNDPSQTADNTVILEWGALSTTGDSFNIGLSSPIDKTKPNFEADLGLTDTFSYQLNSYQYSIVNVSTNSLAPQRITTWAGGEDNQLNTDEANGALFTVGGWNDTNANPADPYLTPIGNFRYDDELYNLAPFIANGDTMIHVDTLNPSNNDNIMAASLYLRSTSAVVGEGIVLTPATATNPINTPHTLTAKAQDANGNPIVGVTITFTITSGPNKGMTATADTNSAGMATWTYSSKVVGTDQIVASFMDPTGKPVTSNTASKIWTSGTNVPEFPTLVLPVGMFVGILLIVYSLKLRKN